MRRRRRPLPKHELPLPKRPFRDSLIFYGALALLIVGVAAVSGGRLLPGDLGEREYGAIPSAIVFFVVATAWSWWRFRVKLKARAERGATRR